MIDILIPVLRRPHNAQPLAESAKVTESPYRLVFICSPRDKPQIAACEALGETVLITDWQPGPADFAKKINWGFDQTDSEWVFQGADDIRFTPGWDTEALRIARRQRKRVIGTNDLHNPSVRRQLTSTHTLIARSYIQQYGSGTEDNTGRIFCELYDHQFVDTEFIEVARRRHEWAPAHRSVVEHLHPHWGNAEMDGTYQKAIRATGKDLALFRERMGVKVRSSRQQRLAEMRASRA